MMQKRACDACHKRKVRIRCPISVHSRDLRFPFIDRFHTSLGEIDVVHPACLPLWRCITFLPSWLTSCPHSSRSNAIQQAQIHPATGVSTMAWIVHLTE